MLSKLRKLAERVIWSMNMKEGQTCTIRGGLHEREFLEEIAVISEKRGIDASVSYGSDEFYKKMYTQVPEKYLKKTSKLGLAMAKVVDNIITVERLENPAIRQNIPHSKFAAATAGGRPISKIYDKRNVKWLYMGWPSMAMAEHFEVSYGLLKRFIWDGTLVPHSLLIRRAKKIVNGLRGAKYVHITDEWGSDLRLMLAPRRKIMIADGYISDSDIRMGDVGLNLPDGEVYTAPLETWGNGVLVVPKQMDRYTEKPIENIRLVFENGKLNLRKCTAEKNQKAMLETIRRSIAIDRKTERIVRTTNVAELGIGLNPVINRAIGYTLTDEKIGGTVHVAIGYNKGKAYGGKSDSCLHWDFVTNRGITLEAIYPNKKSKILIDRGKFKA